MNRVHRIDSPVLRPGRPLQDKDLRQRSEEISGPLSGQMAELAGLSPDQRSGVLAELLKAWGVPDAIAGRMLGLLEAAIVADRE